MVTRYFEYIGHGSAKFWEVSYPAHSLDVAQWCCRWGRIGTNGQSKNFSEPSWHEARHQAVRKIQEKRAKGYVEVGLEVGGPAIKVVVNHSHKTAPPVVTIANRQPAGAATGTRAFDLEDE